MTPMMAVGILSAVLAGQMEAGRIYHRVPLDKMAVTKWTHVEVCSLVTYVRKQQDGDYHVTLAEGAVKVVAEIIPLIPLPAPRKNQRICVRGIRRLDEYHGWIEVHPVEFWQVEPPRTTRRLPTRE